MNFPSKKKTIFDNLKLLTIIKRSEQKLWNISYFDEDVVSRANDEVGKYNRRLNEYFMNVHPNVASFVAIQKKTSVTT
ncbi:hypothetical protein HZS_6888 [Henneguya salminicola]|nr:hypothetical protein HZS_6888 [Henneguya salminicola]